MARMEARVRDLLTREEPLVFLGDYNVIPQREDAAKPDAWTEDALFLPPSRAAFRRILNLGLTEAIRTRDPRPGLYTFWDYQANSWERGNGIRIDHLLLSPQAADLLEGAGIDKEVRAGDKPSDHVPVWVDLAA
jgi:exodeoxyribonuclease-3